MIQYSKVGRAAKIGQVILSIAMVAMEVFDMVKGNPSPPDDD